jgi:ABC-2 type transport system permease protein
MTARMMRLEIRDELLAILREPTAWFFSIVMPVLFFTLFVAMFGGDGTADAGIIAPFGTFAALAVVMMSPGIGLADARERGWLRVKRVSGTPLWVTLVAKVVASIPYTVGVLTAMTVAAILVGSMTVDLVVLTRVVTVLVLGVLPFSLFSLAVGSRAGTNASAAILNGILMPAAIVSGLWFPHEIMPDWLVRIGEFLPTYHLAQLALAQVENGPWLGHLAVLSLTAIVGAAVAAIAYRSARP